TCFSCALSSFYAALRMLLYALISLLPTETCCQSSLLPTESGLLAQSPPLCVRPPLLPVSHDLRCLRWYLMTSAFAAQTHILCLLFAPLLQWQTYNGEYYQKLANITSVQALDEWRNALYFNNQCASVWFQLAARVSNIVGSTVIKSRLFLVVVGAFLDLILRIYISSQEIQLVERHLPRLQTGASRTRFPSISRAIYTLWDFKTVFRASSVGRFLRFRVVYSSFDLFMSPKGLWEFDFTLGARTWISWEFWDANHLSNMNEMSLENVDHEPQFIMEAILDLMAIISSWFHILFATTKWISITRKWCSSSSDTDKRDHSLRTIRANIPTYLVLFGTKSLAKYGWYTYILALISSDLRRILKRLVWGSLEATFGGQGTSTKREEQLSLFFTQSHGGAYGIAAEDRNLHASCVERCSHALVEGFIEGEHIDMGDGRRDTVIIVGRKIELLASVPEPNANPIRPQQSSIMLLSIMPIKESEFYFSSCSPFH
ncbi:hypothetical protein KI387_026156, partial [Taxus chinensis]